MCGIFALVRLGQEDVAPTETLKRAVRIIRHRGPDDEGFLLWDGIAAAPKVYAGEETAEQTRLSLGLPILPTELAWRVGLGHRRLSIVDLSPHGHQPMVHQPSGMAVVFNGEIYNHLELRSELESAGHRFHSNCDTEVLLVAWTEWGPNALQRFNGMFSFVLFDPRHGGTVHAVRDRFGVKPLYWCRVDGTIAFASEPKQFRTLPGFSPRLNEGAVRDYLVSGLLDFSSQTFDERIHQVLGGERAVVRLQELEAAPRLERWYELAPAPHNGSLAGAAEHVAELLEDSVRLRLRADVPVGSCLSGGLDSSAIVSLAHKVLHQQGAHSGQVTVTARFEDSRYDEWKFASQVISATGARSVEVWPTVERLQSELDAQLWHMDEPFGSTSQFSQWCVFAAAADAGLKVMLDGQGSDEQLAGYGGSDASLYAGLLRRAHFVSLGQEVLSFRRRHGILPISQLIFATRHVFPFTDRFLPGNAKDMEAKPEWMTIDAGSYATNKAPRDLNDLLRRQTLATSLPVLLRYEDRNSMARSIEARVPFLDYRLVELIAGLPDSYKLREGVTKLVLRDALKGVVPEDVRCRKDKMGFVTPEEVWLTRTARPWFRNAVAEAAEISPQHFDADRVLAMVDSMADGIIPFSFLPWRILCFGRWLQAQKAPVEQGSKLLSAVRA